MYEFWNLFLHDANTFLFTIFIGSLVVVGVIAIWKAVTLP
jgi:hypothetical protein